MIKASNPYFILFVLFLGLKLCHQIDWSWWWVFSPMFLYWGLLLMSVILGAAAKYLEQKADQLERKRP